MNFLGHLFLSGDEPLVITGNFMADAVKGRDLSRFHPDLQRGIRLHRAIDSFTDQHPANRTGRERVRTHAGRYSGVVMDLFYDHLLASRWSDRSKEPLPEFAQRMYTLLLDHGEHLPERTAHMLPFMVKHDWLTSYATLQGIGRALAGLAQRVPMGSPMVGAERVLAGHIDVYRSEFDVFLPDIQQHLAAL
ncbi:MAG: ACP phosphodiesterase [Flavobacteriales bacterium]